MVRGDPGMDSSDPNINVWAVDLPGLIYTKEASSTKARQLRQWERRVG